MQSAAVPDDRPLEFPDEPLLFDESEEDPRAMAHAERQLRHFLETAEAIDKLFQQALSHPGSNAFDEFLDFAVRFSNLSIYNAMLVKVQRPGAVAVATRGKWKEAGGAVRPDAIPIVILRPFGPVSFVYESADVDGVRFPGEDASSLFAAGEVSESAYRKMVQAARARRIKIIETDQYGTLLAGTAAAIDRLPDSIAPSREGPLWSVKVNAKHDLPTRFATLAHELGHIYCGHLDRDPKGQWPDRRGEATSHAQREMEAEAVCWLVCRRNGVTSRSKEYLSSLINETDPGKVSMFAIYSAANRVEGRSG